MKKNRQLLLAIRTPIEFGERSLLGLPEGESLRIEAKGDRISIFIESFGDVREIYLSPFPVDFQVINMERPTNLKKPRRSLRK